MPRESQSYEGLAAWADVTRIAGLAGGALASYLVPPSIDAATAAFLVRMRQRWLPGSLRRVSEKMRRALPVECLADPDEAARAFWLMRLEDTWGRARGVRRLNWRPQVRIEGMDRLETALSRGSGAILWGLRFGSATAMKQAFHQAGRPLIHLSRAEHGSPTNTRLGIGVAAPLYCRAETPYLRERVVIPLDGLPRYLQHLRRRLRENHCLSIFGEHTGRQNVVRRVLTADLEFAVGAPSLAWSEGSALLTVSVHREGPFRYRVQIGEEIPVDRSVPRKLFAETAVTELARRLEELIRRYPSDWQGWAYRDFA